MTFYESLQEMCIDLGIGVDSLMEFSQLSNEEYSLIIKDVSLKGMIENIKANDYYNRLVRRIGVDSVDLVERQYLNGKWCYVLIRFNSIPLGTNCIIRTLSVPYTTDIGMSVNLETQAIYDSVRNEELSDRV